MTIALTVVALVLAALALFQGVMLRRRMSSIPKRASSLEILQRLDGEVGQLSGIVDSLVPRVDRLEGRVRKSITRTAVTHYDAYDNIAGNLSRTIALLDDDGDGLVISVFVGRVESRFYTKMVRNGKGTDDPLTPEEAAAVKAALTS